MTRRSTYRSVRRQIGYDRILREDAESKITVVGAAQRIIAAPPTGFEDTRTPEEIARAANAALRGEP